MVKDLNMSNLLVVLPSWVGDVVLATPVLKALRAHFASTHITYLMRPYVRQVLSGCPWVDDVTVWPGRPLRNPIRCLEFLTAMKGRNFSCILLLPNSFGTGFFAWLVGAPRRVGYARDFRGPLLTDKLQPLRHRGRPVVESMLTYYARLAAQLGCEVNGRSLTLFTDPRADGQVSRWFGQFGITSDRRVIVLNPGGAFGPSKRYPAERFSEIADWLAAEYGAHIVITGGPNDREVVMNVQRHMRADAACVLPPELDLQCLKSLIARSNLLITNDTGPRHFAIALNIPVVTIFGPTHPGWTESYFEREKKVMVAVDCGPCQKPICPLDQRCMARIEPQRVISAARELLGEPSTVAGEQH